MDEIKLKVLNFVKKQNVHTSDGNRPDPISPPGDDADIRNNELTVKREVQQEEVIEDEEVLKQIDENYFATDSDFDACRYQLMKLPDVLEVSDLKKDVRVLYRQHGVVSKKTLQLILEKESACKIELERIQQLQCDIAETLAICRTGRESLTQAKQQFTTTSLGILSNYKRKQSICQLLRSLNTIKTMQKTDERLQELLAEENYPGAIHLLLECQIVAANFNHFKCVAQLSWKLQDTLYMTEEQLDIALSKICRKFNLSSYTKLQEAYKLLDKTQTVMDQLLMHFTSELHSAVFNIVHSYALPTATVKQYQELCKNVPTNQFIPCLQSLCQAIWHIVNSYYQVVGWHQAHDKEPVKTDIPEKDVEITLNRQYVKQKLENGLQNLWKDVQGRISLYLLGHELAEYKFEELLQILGIIHRLMEIGDEFCKSKSTTLEKSIRQQTISYFRNYHANKLEELRIFLENESWTPCPLRPSFNLLYLQEFIPIRNTIENYRKIKKQESGSEKAEADGQNSSSNLSTDGSSYQHYNYFTKFQDGDETPFDMNYDESFEEDILSNVRDELSGYFSESSEDSENEELKRDFVEESPLNVETGVKKRKKTAEEKSRSGRGAGGPLVCNTTLTVLRLLGRYLQMCQLLKPIAIDVIMCMCQLFDYYLYNVCRFFTTPLPVQSPSMYSFKLQTTIKRIEENLILSDTPESDTDVQGKIVASTLSDMVKLNERESLFGLCERIVGVESLVFLGSQFEYIQPYILHIAPEQKKHVLQHFYMQTVSCVTDARRPAYMCVSGNIVDMPVILREMSKVNFEVKDVMSEHSPYVDRIVRDLQIFSMKLEDLDLDLPEAAYLVIWENIVHMVNNTLVNGFSNVKKCSNGGRALMQLDYTQLLSKLEKLTTLRPLPNKEYVDAYVKAYYLQENNLEDWIQQHKEYSSKHMEALIHCSCQNSKKTKQRLLQILDSVK